MQDRLKDVAHSAWSRRGWITYCSLLLAAPLTHARNAPGSSRVVVVGDSLSAEYGLPRGAGWVALLQNRLAKRAGPSVEVVNASISGDTTAGGLSRLPTLLRRHRPSHVVIELGGNDALRGLPLDTTRQNLRRMVSLCREAGAEVLLVGIAVPPNYGARYGESFTQLFGEVAKAEKVPLVPFLLAGVADVPQARELFQADGIHPTAQAQTRMLDNVWPALDRLLR
ncbi:arylesterase [Ideonella livida]|uniref:Arylesterase n=1 Tax=Ideonella livida TaxID=2707176 RepID=A0A7C9TK96_9BURK|nr:arylesterase [Ideonella livida]NDY90767.1 arylesterase [Ideonella livida]